MMLAQYDLSKDEDERNESLSKCLLHILDFRMTRMKKKEKKKERRKKKLKMLPS